MGWLATVATALLLGVLAPGALMIRKASNRIERLFVHQNFADEYRKRMGHVEVEDES